ncbi:MAG: hypothetical protein AAGF95_30835 [Chloroflexota bacterium]
MCCYKRKPVERVHTHQEAYEGETVRLDPSTAQWQPVSSTTRCHHFPWWILWFIWPAFFMLKWLAPIIIGSSAAMLQTLSTISVPLLPLILIGIGAALLYRERTRTAQNRPDSTSYETYSEE